MTQARFNNIDEWLRWQESCHPSAIDLGLDRIQAVAQRMGLKPSSNTQVITVAGTNGKGSCIAALQAQLRALGYSVGAYTSPHIKRYNERVSINGRLASDQDFCQAFESIDRQRGDISLTYFEFGTLAALHLFAQQDLDFWLLEVGLGGRLDATNIIDADLAVITPIALDHTEWLGDSREQIALEKAGICRPQGAVVCADPAPPMTLVEHLEQLHCKASYLGEHFGFDGNKCWSKFAGETQAFNNPSNLPKASVVAAVHVLHRLGLLHQARTQIEEALASLTLSGRFQRMELNGRVLVLDVAHNAHAMGYLNQKMNEYFRGEKCTVVLAMMADKRIGESVQALSGCVKHWCLTTIPGMTRAATVDQMREQLPEGLEYSVAPSVEEALDALLKSNRSDPILITGSFFTVAAATDYLMETYGLAQPHEGTEA